MIKKSILFSMSFLSISSSALGGDVERLSVQTHPSRPLFAHYQSLPNSEKLTYMLDESMRVLSEDCLKNYDVSSYNIAQSCTDPKFRVEDHIPKSAVGEAREALRVIATHYVELLSVRRVFIAATAPKLDLIQTSYSDLSFIPESYNKEVREASGDYKHHYGRILQVSSKQKKIEKAAAQIEAVEQEMVPQQVKCCFVVQVPSSFNFVNHGSLHLCFDVLPLDSPYDTILDGQFLTLRKIHNAYEYMKSYGTGISPHGGMDDITHTFSAGAELKNALDTLLGTKRVDITNVHNMTFNNFGSLEYQQRERDSKRELVKAFQEEISDPSLTSPKIKEKLEAKMRAARAELKSLENSLKVVEANMAEESDFNKSIVPESLIEKAQLRHKILLMLKKVPELFLTAFEETQPAQIEHFKKKFGINS